MTDRQKLQKLINKIVIDSQKAAALANEIFGEQAQLFLEAGGGLHVMNADCDGALAERQGCIELTADGFCQIGIGAW